MRQLCRVGAAREPEVGERGAPSPSSSTLDGLTSRWTIPRGVQRVQPLRELRGEVDRLVEPESTASGSALGERAAAVVRHHE